MGNHLGKRYKGVGTAPERLPIVGGLHTYISMRGIVMVWNGTGG